MVFVEENVSQKKQALEYFKNNGGIYFDVVNLGILEKDGWRVLVDFKAFYNSSSYYSVYSLR